MKSLNTSAAVVASVPAVGHALATEECGIMHEAAEMAAPDSNAQAYAIYLAAASQANRDGGYPSDKQIAKPTEDGFSLCPQVPSDDNPCSDYTNIKHEGDRIADFDAGGKALSGRLSLGAGTSQPLGDMGEASMIAAYKSIAGAVVVVFEVSSATQCLFPIATYTAPDGRQAESTLMTGPSELGEDTFANYVFFFEGAEFGGDVYLEAIGGDGYDSAGASFPTE